MICVPDDKTADHIVRNGLDCIGTQEGVLYSPIPGRWRHHAGQRPQSLDCGEQLVLAAPLRKHR